LTFNPAIWDWLSADALAHRRCVLALLIAVEDRRCHRESRFPEKKPPLLPCECAPILLSGEMYAKLTACFAEGNSGENGNDDRPEDSDGKRFRLFSVGPTGRAGLARNRERHGNGSLHRFEYAPGSWREFLTCTQAWASPFAQPHVAAVSDDCVQEIRVMARRSTQ
jgi:hypothetical protein